MKVGLKISGEKGGDDMRKGGVVEKPVIMGLIGGLILLFLYFVILTIANSFDHAIEQFIGMWYLILPLIVGFGVQVGLYSHIRKAFCAGKMSGSTRTIVTTGGLSTTSMIACCIHHVIDVLPVIGFSALAIFLNEYQLVFMILGILSNLVGITMMMTIIQRNGLYSEESFLQRMFKYDMKVIRNGTIFWSVFIFSLVFGVAMLGNIRLEGRERVFSLPTKVSEERGVSFQIKPIDFSFDKKSCL